MKFLIVHCVLFKYLTHQLETLRINRSNNLIAHTALLLAMKRNKHNHNCGYANQIKKSLIHKNSIPFQECSW